MKYRKIPIICPGLMFVQKSFLVGLFSVELIFWRGFNITGGKFASQNELGLTLKTAKTTKITA